jgi:hypothetical protein
MNELKIESFREEIVIYFGTKQKAINAYTLASTLVSLADAIKAANEVINPGYDIEVLITDLGSGSFKAVIKAIYKSAKNLLSAQRLEAIILSILAAFLYDTFFSRKPNVTVNVSNEYVIVEQGDDRVVIPKQVQEAKEKVVKRSEFKLGVSNAIQAIKQDKNIDSFSIVDSIDEIPIIEIDRDNFDTFIIDKAVADTIESIENERPITENTTIQIIKAILENSQRKWEFVWHGRKISAPVLDEIFYMRFYKHEITIAPGDSLNVELRIYQRKADGINVYLNYKYEVVKVLKHIPAEIRGENLYE